MIVIGAIAALKNYGDAGNGGGDRRCARGHGCEDERPI